MTVLSLALELSRVVPKAYWVCQGDHSCVGGYARFEHGAMVEQAGDGDVFVDGDDYVDVPERKWRAATGAPITPEEFFFHTFPDGSHPPVRMAAEPSKQIAFDPARFEVSLD